MMKSSKKASPNQDERLLNQDLKNSQRSSGIRWQFALLLAMSSLFLGGLFPRLVLAESQNVNAAIGKTIPVSPDFHDVARVAGLIGKNVYGDASHKKYIIETTGNGVAVFDFNNDGWLDIFLVNGWRLEGFSNNQAKPTSHLYRNDGEGTFTDVTVGAGLDRTGWGQGVCVGDWDSNGFDDLFFTFFGASVLYRNRGDGTFEEVTEAAGLSAGEERWSTGCAFMDFDRDGDLDLFIANYLKFDIRTIPEPGENRFCQWKGMPVMCGPLGLPGETNILYRNNGNGTFTDVSVSSGISEPAENYAFSPLVADFNNDQWPDIYVACDSTANLLYVNQKNGTFTEEGSYAGAAFNEEGRAQAGMGVAAADYNNDGLLDVFVTNFSEDYFTLYRNDGESSFTDVTNKVQLAVNTRFLGWGTAFIDFDHDGWKDIFAANGHVYPEVESLGQHYKQAKLLYRNLGNGTFDDVSQQSGPGMRRRHASRGIAFGDLDNDGRVEIVVNNMSEIPSLLFNRGTCENSVLIRLVGSKSNHNGIGARVRVTANKATQIDEVRSGGSYMSQNDFRLHFGVGGAEQIERLEVRWPSGEIDTVMEVAANALITIVEGRGVTNRKPYNKPFLLWQGDPDP